MLKYFYSYEDRRTQNQQQKIINERIDNDIGIMRNPGMFK